MCVNNNQMAMGLLSSTGYFTLYSVASLNRVWHRELPSSDSSLLPSSVIFCESNILVGRANNTHFDLVQITSDVAILSSIQLSAPTLSASDSHFCQAQYDRVSNILWVSSFARGSVYAFRYALKGYPPVTGASDALGTVVGYDQVAEFPIEPVLSFVLGGDGSELFFATPNGISMATIDQSALKRILDAPAAVKAKAQPPAVHSREASNGRNGENKKMAKPLSRQVSNKPTPSVPKDEVPAEAETPNMQPKPKKVVAASTAAPVSSAPTPSSPIAPPVPVVDTPPVKASPVAVVPVSVQNSPEAPELIPTPGLSAEDLSRAFKKVRHNTSLTRVSS
jgi:hypothetical protein